MKSKFNFEGLVWVMDMFHWIWREDYESRREQNELRSVWNNSTSAAIARLTGDRGFIAAEQNEDCLKT